MDIGVARGKLFFGELSSRRTKVGEGNGIVARSAENVFNQEVVASRADINTVLIGDIGGRIKGDVKKMSLGAELKIHCPIALIDKAKSRNSNTLHIAEVNAAVDRNVCNAARICSAYKVSVFVVDGKILFENAVMVAAVEKDVAAPCEGNVVLSFLRSPIFAVSGVVGKEVNESIVGKTDMAVVEQNIAARMQDNALIDLPKGFFCSFVKARNDDRDGCLRRRIDCRLDHGGITLKMLKIVGRINTFHSSCSFYSHVSNCVDKDFKPL